MGRVTARLRRGVTVGARGARSVARAALLAAFALATIGCGEHLVGTNDVALEYRSADRRAEAETLRASVTRRLASGQVTADVDARGGDAITVTVDGDAASAVDDLLTWRGGVTVHAIDPAAPVRTGSSASVLDDAATRAPPPDDRVLVQAIDGDTARARVVRARPVLDLTEGITGVDARRGRTLLLHLTPEARARAQAAIAAHGSEPLVVARHRSALVEGPLTLEGDALVLPFPPDPWGYARAHRARQLLATPTLPALTRTSARPLPTNVPLAAASVALPMLLSLAWLFFVRRFDRSRPEPAWLVLATFALGCASVVPAGLAEYALARATPYLDPTLMTLGGQVLALPIAIVVFTIVVGLSEEGAKLFAAWLLPVQRREFDEPVDGIVYGAAAALGFAAVENVKYFAVGRLSPMVVILRTFTSIPAHTFFGAIWGYALGRRLVSPRTSVLAYLAAAALAHGAFDALLSIDATAGFALLLNAALATTFIVLLRRALRHGVVTAEAASVPASRRAFFRLGSTGAFAASVVAVHALAVALFAVGVTMEASRHRVGVPVVAALSVLVVLLALSAWSLASTMPLDAAVDDYGITFAGATRPWRSVIGLARGPRGVVVRSDEGDLELAPGSRATLDALARAIAAYVPRAGAPPSRPRDDDAADGRA